MLHTMFIKNCTDTRSISTPPRGLILSVKLPPPSATVSMIIINVTSTLVVIMRLTLGVYTSFFLVVMRFIALYTTIIRRSDRYISTSTAVYGSTSLTIPSIIPYISTHCILMFFLSQLTCSPFLYPLSWNICIL